MSGIKGRTGKYIRTERHNKILSKNNFTGRFKKGHTPWCKGKINIHSKKTLSKLRMLRKTMVGEKSNAWKGGRISDFQGYILIYLPTHPYANNCGYVREHRFIMEKYIGRYLLKSDIVHHLNGIKYDNRIENLALCNGKTHHLFIKKLQERIQALEKEKNYGL